MLLAKIENGNIIEVKHFRQMFPNVSFPITGPSDDFLAENNVKKVRTDLQFDANTQFLVGVEPYILNDNVYNVVVQNKPQEEVDQANFRRLLQVAQGFTMEAQARLDEFAKQRGYDNILSACSYVTSKIPRFINDANRAIDLRDQWWLILNEIFEKVVSGQRAEPVNFEELLPELPELTWETTA